MHRDFSSVVRNTIYRSAFLALPALALAACEGDGGPGLGTLPAGAQVAALHDHDDDEADSLYVGNRTGDDTVKRFDTRTGAFLGNFVPNGGPPGGTPGTPLAGASALLFAHDRMYVVNQNAAPASPLTGFTGEVQLYDDETGGFAGRLFAAAPCDASTPAGLSACIAQPQPFAPQGAVLGRGNVLYIADPGAAPNAALPAGRLTRWDACSGASLGDLPVPKLDDGDSFHPRGAVFGPDRKLYVASRNLEQIGGDIVRFDPRHSLDGEVLYHNGVGKGAPELLMRPDGIAFGPDRRLYVTSFRRNSKDNDKILVFQLNDAGKLDPVDRIDLDVAGQPRAFAQALLFGPGGKLYVPITGQGPGLGLPYGPSTGEVRVYDVHAKTYTVLVPPFLKGGPLTEPWFLTFGRTDPRTLAYGRDRDDDDRDDRCGGDRHDRHDD